MESFRVQCKYIESIFDQLNSNRGEEMYDIAMIYQKVVMKLNEKLFLRTIENRSEVMSNVGHSVHNLIETQFDPGDLGVFTGESADSSSGMPTS